MHTTAGCLVLVDSVVQGDAAVIAKLRAQGAIILGKTNLTELSNSKGDLPNGYSQRGGQCQSAYVAGLDPSGSSSGSAVAVSAGFAPAAVGVEVYGGLVMPASRNACFAIKPTINVVSQHGLILSSLSMDTVGPLAKSAYDAALLLTCMISGPGEKDVSRKFFDFIALINVVCSDTSVSASQRTFMSHKTTPGSPRSHSPRSKTRSWVSLGAICSTVVSGAHGGRQTL
jgi:Asp-tRNA(Asn)/Glu-tRNA(Gln) amidotransferase A subunit family amidase